MTDQTRAQVVRYVDGLVVTAVATLVGLILVSRLGCFAVQLLKSVSASTLTAVAIAFALTLLWWGRESVRRLFVRKFIRRYPPTWWIAVNSVLLVALLVLSGADLAFSRECGFEPIEQALLPLWMVPWIFLSVQALIWIQAPPPSLVGSVASSAPTAPPIATQDGSIAGWKNRLRPLDQGEPDLLGRAAFAGRVAKAAMADEVSGGIAIIGPLGSGKTSLSELVTREMRRSGVLVEQVVVSLWPYESTEAALAAVIRAATQRLDHVTGTPSLGGVSSEYLDLIDEAPGVLKATFKALSPQTTTAALQQVESVCRALGVVLVIWVEDLERFALFDATESGAGMDMAPLRSLLSELARLKSIRVVLSTTSHAAKPDLDRVVQISFAVPIVDSVLVATLVEAYYRQRMQSGWPVTISWPDKLKRWTPSLGGLVDHVGLLFETPRGVQQFLIVFDELWLQLSGEIDFDDLFVATALQVATPDVFNDLTYVVPQIRGWHRDPREQQKLVDGAVAKSLIGKSESVGEAVRWCIQFLFFSGEIGGQRLRSAQTDYWGRFISGRLDVLQLHRDQPFLVAIEAWRVNRDAGLIALMSVRSGTPNSASSFLMLQLAWDERLALLRECCCRAARSVGGAHEPPPAVVLCWNSFELSRLHDSQLAELVSDLIREEGKRNLGLAYHLLSLFGSDARLDSRAGANVLYDRLEESVRSLLVSVASQSDGAEKLCSLFDGEQSGLLSFLVFGVYRMRASPSRPRGWGFSGWTQVRQTVLAALDRSPQIVLPQMLSMVVSVTQLPVQNLDEFVESYTADAELLSEVWPELPTWLASHEVPTSLRRHAEAVMEASNRRDLVGNASNSVE